VSEGFRTFDHTGDLGLEVWAGSSERLFGLAAEALLAQIAIVPPGAAGTALAVDLELEADDPEDLLVHWLNTALLEAEIRRAIWTRATIARWSPTALTARLEGPRFDPRRHTALREVKAVSHHGLELRLAPPCCRCRLVIDL
jgi:SHS2 domain-containing protein